MKLTIKDGRDHFYTFDTNRILLLTATDEDMIKQVEFSTEENGEEVSWTSEVLTDSDGIKFVQVPNEFLNGDYTRLVCYYVALDSNGEYTRQKEIFRIRARQEPQDYFLTYSERVTFASIKALTEQYKATTKQYMDTTEGFKDNAGRSAELASKYAENNEDVAVEPGKYSAKHWSIKAEAAKETAVQKAKEAGTSEANSKTYMESAKSAKQDAEKAKNAANIILEQVQSKGTEITNFVATSKTEIETQKDESVNAVKSVYQTDLNELKGDLSDIDKSVITLKNGVFAYPLHFEIGLIDTNGLDVENTGWYRTEFIPYDINILQDMIADSELQAIYFGYDADKNLIKRAYYKFSGTKAITGISNAVYVRFCVDKPNVDKFSVIMRKKFAFDTDLNTVVESVNKVSELVDMHANVAFCNISTLISASSEKCIHHDNFSRTMEGYDIGKNSEGELTDNSYSRVGGADYDDGLRVSEQCLFLKDVNTNNFTLRKISVSHFDNYMVETNLPNTTEMMIIGNNAVDDNNFEAIFVSKKSTYFDFFQRKVVKGSFVNGKELKYYSDVANILKIYYYGLFAHIFVDDYYVGAIKMESMDGYVYIGAYKMNNAIYKFVNIFDLVTPPVYNTGYYIDNDISDFRKSVINANEGRYSIDAEITRFSNRSEKFVLYSDDPKISNGRRTERSLVALLPNNLRTMRYSFDVYFPSSVGFDMDSPSYGDIFFQLHDRQVLNVSRGKVPFTIGVVGDKILVSVYSSDRQASDTLIEQVKGYEIMTVPTDKWTHFDIFVRERYEERQYPFISIDVDGKRVFECRKPNCPNDVNGSSAQYGEYKNNWGVITSSIRYFDNFKVTY